MAANRRFEMLGRRAEKQFDIAKRGAEFLGWFHARFRVVSSSGDFHRRASKRVR
jgi:hypothetical protein